MRGLHGPLSFYLALYNTLSKPYYSINFAAHIIRMGLFFDNGQLAAFHNPVLTIGTFDGVHLGHKTILNEVVRQAKEVNGESVLITFEPHPRKLLFPDQPLQLLTSPEQKFELIFATGIQHIVVVPFTREFSSYSAAGYISDFLVEKFHPHTIIIGYDHRFGHDRLGDINLLKQYQEDFNYQLAEIPAKLIDEAAVSSTKIRKALIAGQVQDAAHMMGRYYNLRGTVIHGNHLGRTIGYPTANIQLQYTEQLIPAVGIYAVYVTHNGTRYRGMLSIGYNPTVSDAHQLHIEVNILDFDKDIYGDTLEIAFVTYLRNEEKFASLEALKEQLHKDKENTIHALATATQYH